MDFKLSQFFPLTEMPHMELPTHDVVDLRVERYPVSQEEKKKLFLAFKTTGFVGKLKDLKPEQYAFFSEKEGVRLASPTEETQLPHLPDDWETYLLHTDA